VCGPRTSPHYAHASATAEETSYPFVWQQFAIIRVRNSAALISLLLTRSRPSISHYSQKLVLSFRRPRRVCIQKEVNQLTNCCNLFHDLNRVLMNSYILVKETSLESHPRKSGLTIHRPSFIPITFSLY